MRAEAVILTPAEFEGHHCSTDPGTLVRYSAAQLRGAPAEAVHFFGRSRPALACPTLALSRAIVHRDRGRRGSPPSYLSGCRVVVNMGAPIDADETGTGAAAAKSQGRLMET